MLRWKSGSLFCTMNLRCLIPRSLVTEGAKEVMNIVKRQVHENSSFDPFLMASIIATGATRNKDPVQVTQSKDDLWRPQRSLCSRYSWNCRSLSPRLNLYCTPEDALKSPFSKWKRLKQLCLDNYVQKVNQITTLANLWWKYRVWLRKADLTIATHKYCTCPGAKHSP